MIEICQKLIRKMLIFMVVFAGMLILFACAQIKKDRQKDFFGFPTGYVSQQRIVRQGLAMVPTRHGEKQSIYFGYDRNSDFKNPTDKKGQDGIDLIEYKQLLLDNSWNWDPFLIFSDDNFNGFADRLFLDQDLNGSLDTVVDIRTRNINMNNINFLELNPWAMD